jgi:hypothetical protein
VNDPFSFLNFTGLYYGGLLSGVLVVFFEVVRITTYSRRRHRVNIPLGGKRKCIGGGSCEGSWQQGLVDTSRKLTLFPQIPKGCNPPIF